MTAVKWRIRPSMLLEIDDCYTAYCLDEACAYIGRQLEDEKEPRFKSKHKSFRDLYAGCDSRGVKHVC